jgi:cytochrome b561
MFILGIKEHDQIMSTNSLTAEPELVPASVVSTAVKPKRYHPLLVSLHWLIALMIFGTVLLIQSNEGGERVRPAQGNFAPSQQGQGLQQQGTLPQNSQQGNPPQRGFPQGGFPQREGSQGVFSVTGLHMLVGITILTLLIVRLIVRLTTQHPEWASAGNKFFDWVGNLTHYGLYIFTFAMTLTGIVLANQRGFLARTFGIGSMPTPGSFRRGGFSLGFLHGGIWTVLLLLILLHVGAALYHQFYLKDNLLGRMWFGKRTG